MKKLICLLLVFMLLPAALAHTPATLTCLENQTVVERRIFHYNDMGWLTSLEETYTNTNENYTLSFSYDAEGRILTADYDQSWHYGNNQVYTYDDQGRMLTCTHLNSDGNPRQRTEYTYGEDGLVMEIIHTADPITGELLTYSIYTYTYVYDDQGRVSEAHRHIQFTQDDGMQYADGSSASDYVTITRYTYDGQNRVATESSVQLPKAQYNASGHPDLVFESVTEYYRDFSPFVIEYAASPYPGTWLCLTDAAGTALWFVSIEDHVLLDGDRIVSVQNEDGSVVWELTYAD